MVIRLTKGKGKPDALTCVRDDGTTTWTRLKIPVVHDIVHYAVETVLDRRESFYGLVAGGMNITDFDVPGGVQALGLSPEAGETEFIVNAFHLEMMHGAPFEDFNERLRAMCAEKGARTPREIAAADLKHIREQIARLHGAWHALEPGAFMELDFREPGR